MSDDAWKDIPLSPAKKFIAFTVLSVLLILTVIAFVLGEDVIVWMVLLAMSFGWGAAWASRYTHLFDWMDA
jgi:hypothetical protein